jgi:hypothetical protein
MAAALHAATAPSKGGEEEEEARRPLLIPLAAAASKPSASGAYGSLAVVAEEADTPLVTITTTTSSSAASAFSPTTSTTAADAAPPTAAALLLSALLLAHDDDDDDDSSRTHCRARRQLGPWLALALAVTGAVVAGVIGPFFGWPRPFLFLVLAPCVVLAALPLAPALVRAASLRYVFLGRRDLMKRPVSHRTGHVTTCSSLL